MVAAPAAQPGEPRPAEEGRGMAPGKDSIVLALGEMDGKSADGLDLPAAEGMRVEPAIVKKIAGKAGSRPYRADR